MMRHRRGRPSRCCGPAESWSPRCRPTNGCIRRAMRTIITFAATASNNLPRCGRVAAAETLLLSHYNTLLFAPAAAVRLASKLFASRTNAGDLALPPRALNTLLARAMGSEAHLLGRVPLPFGLSLVAVVRRRSNAETDALRSAA